MTDDTNDRTWWIIFHKLDMNKDKQWRMVSKEKPDTLLPHEFAVEVIQKAAHDTIKTELETLKVMQ